MPTVRKSSRIPMEYTDPRDELLSRFVVDLDGSRKGETVSTEGDRLVIMESGIFYLVPMSFVVLDGKLIRLKGRVNWKRAKALGDRWKARKIDPL
ncbi:MAG: hypothetical protein MUC62_09985 [Candidatus Thermoplasmatota archaeon]|nr:hypothetical protein [Candidatus Thermoplasmatota archaeon]